MVLSDIVERIKSEDLEVADPERSPAGGQRLWGRDRRQADQPAARPAREGRTGKVDDRPNARNDKKSRPAAPASMPGRVTR